MQELLGFFENLRPAVRTGLLAGGLVLFWVLEGAVPLFSFRYRRFRHAALNLLLTAFQLTVGFSFALLIIKAATFTTTHRFGVLYLFDLPLWLHVLLGVLLLDLIGAYLIHWLEHQVKWMWKFHLIHHTDQQVDVTTGLRHHPGETVFRSSFAILGILVVGVPVGVVFLYQTLSIFFAHLTHANIQPPARLDRFLAYFFVTPNFHKVHHHFAQPLTDTNFGNIFSVWDRLFGTAADVDDPRSLVYGIDTHMDPRESEHVGNLLLLPFRRYGAPSGTKFAAQEQNEEDAG